MGLNSLPIEKQIYIPVGYITCCDLLPGLDVSLWEEDEDLELWIIPMVRIGNTGMVGSGQTDADKWCTFEVSPNLNKKENIRKSFV